MPAGTSQHVDRGLVARRAGAHARRDRPRFWSSLCVRTTRSGNCARTQARARAADSMRERRRASMMQGCDPRINDELLKPRCGAAAAWWIARRSPPLTSGSLPAMTTRHGRAPAWSLSRPPQPAIRGGADAPLCVAPTGPTAPFGACGVRRVVSTSMVSLTTSHPTGMGSGVNSVSGWPVVDVRECCHGRNRCELRRVSLLEDSWRPHRYGRRLHLHRLPGGRQAVHCDPRRRMGRNSPEFRDIRQLQRGAVSARDTVVSRDPWLSQLRVAIQQRNKRPDSRARSLRGRPGGPRQPPI